MRQINSGGLNLLKKWEGCKLDAYQDIGGIWTIGYGHTGPEVVKGMSFTPEQAVMQLQKDLEKFYTIDNYISEQTNENQYSAIVCLCYNVGLRAVKLSQTLKLVNEGLSPDKEWLGFDKVNGVVIPGLLNRRRAELVLYHELS